MRLTHGGEHDRGNRGEHRNRRIFRIAVGVGLFAAAASAVSAAEITHELAYRYPHVWRGITLREFPVLNASTTLAYDNGFGLQVWVGMDLSDDAGRGGEIQEIDLDLHYTWRSTRWQGTVGYVELIFPGGIDNTGELYAKVRSRGRYSAGLEVYYNVDLLEDAFALLDFTGRWSLAPNAQASVVASVGYSGQDYSRFFGGSASGFHHWSTTVDLDVGLPPRRTSGRGFGRPTLKLRLAYTDNLDADVLGPQPARFWGGVYLSTRQSLGR